MPISNYPNGFSQGVSILGMPVLNSYAGSVFWVNSNGGSDGNKGTRERAFGTLDYAIGKCTATSSLWPLTMLKQLRALLASPLMLLALPSSAWATTTNVLAS